VITPLPVDSPPPQFGEHVPGEGAAPEPSLTFEDDRLAGSLGDAAQDAELVDAARDVLRRGQSRTVELGGRSLFVEAFPVRPRLVIVGATEMARALASIAGTLGYERIVVDARPAFAAAERFPDVERLINDWPEDAFEAIGLGPNDAVAVLSHDAKFDEPAIAEALRRGARYVGAVGSRKTQGDRRARLREAGVGEDDLARLHGPIGLDLGGRAPAETALSIMAEIVADRFGGSGRPMLEKVRAVEVA
jgi:xanthine dehydrogenase accessory factor